MILKHVSLYPSRMRLEWHAHLTLAVVLAGVLLVVAWCFGFNVKINGKSQ
jgi:nitrate reductase NapE component